MPKTPVRRGARGFLIAFFRRIAQKYFVFFRKLSRVTKMLTDKDLRLIFCKKQDIIQV